MATLTYSLQAQMGNPAVWGGSTTALTNTYFTVTNYVGRSATYYGNFILGGSGQLIGGTLTGIDSYKNFSLEYILRNVNVDFPTFANLVNVGDTYGAGALALTGADTIFGSVDHDHLIGFDGNDRLFGNAGNDTINGGAGIDTAVLSGASSNYTLYGSISMMSVTDKVGGRDGLDTLSNIERLQFSDTTIAFDIGSNQTAGSGYMLYKAAFNRAPDAGGLGYWISKMDSGMSYNDVAKNFVTSAEFKTAFGGSNPSVNTLVTKLYNNVLNRTPDAGGLAFWQDKLNTGWSTADVLGFFSTSGENVTNVTPLIANGISYTQFVG